jgi:hypothetical protein
LGEQYRSVSSSLCSFLHSPVISSLSGPNTILNTLFSISSDYVPPSMWASCFTPIQNNRQNYSSVNLNL